MTPEQIAALYEFALPTSVALLGFVATQAQGILAKQTGRRKVLGDPRRIQKIGRDVYRIAFKPLSFLVLNLQPIVDLRVWTDASGIVRLESVGYEIRGVDYIKYGFKLELAGKLFPTIRHGRTSLIGRAALQVRVQLPPMLQFTPKALIESTGSAMLTGILGTIESRLRQDLIPDYLQWAQELDRNAA